MPPVRKKNTAAKKEEKISLTDGLNTRLTDKELINLVNQLDISFFITDHKFKIKLVNKVFTDLTGLTDKQIIGKNMLKYVSKLNDFDIKLWKKHPYKDEYRVVLEFNTAKGNFFFYINTYRKYSSKTLYVIKLTDYTETARYFQELNLLNSLSDLNIQKLHKANENLTSSREAERAAISEKELFFSKISHELRTPIGGIIGIASLLKDMTDDLEKKNLINGIIGSATHLNGVVSDLLDFNKLNSGNFALHFHLFNLRSSLSNFFTLFEKGYTNKKISTGFVIDDAVPEWVYGDEQRLRQVFYNLLSNAFKFTDSGQVIFSVRKMNESARKVKIQFVVEDNGRGIPSGDSEKVFEPYQQATSKTPYGVPGTGLGLNICRQLVTLHGGKIYFKSQEGEGTTFYVEIEFEKPKEKVVESFSELNQKPLFGNKILVADDNEINRLYLSTLMKSRGAEVNAVENGQELLNFITKKPVDIILLDVQMPVMDGMETLVNLRKKLKNKVPVIITSAYVSKSELQRFKAAGANAYLQKPTNEDELINAVLLCLDKPELTHSYLISNRKNKVNDKAEVKINIKFIRDISSGDEEFVRQFLQKLMVQINEQFQALKTAYKEENFDLFKRLAHRLKSSILYLGMESQANLLNEFEEYASEKQMRSKKTEQQLLVLEGPITMALRQAHHELQKDTLEL